MFAKRMKWARLVQASFLAWILVSTASAMIVLLPLEEMVAKADLVLVGRVLEIVETSEEFVLEHQVPGKTGRAVYWKATLAVDTVLKGESKSQSVEVYYLPQFTGEASFAKDEKCVLFTRIHGTKRTVLNGHGGKVRLVDDKALSIFMAGQEQEQRAFDFIEKIKKLVS